MQVMEELGLIGLRIQRMPNEPDLEFGIPSQYSYMTVSPWISFFFHFKIDRTLSYDEEGMQILFLRRKQTHA